MPFFLPLTYQKVLLFLDIYSSHLFPFSHNLVLFISDAKDGAPPDLFHVKGAFSERMSGSGSAEPSSCPPTKSAIRLFILSGPYFLPNPI